LLPSNNGLSSIEIHKFSERIHPSATEEFRISRRFSLSLLFAFRSSSHIASPLKTQLIRLPQRRTPLKPRFSDLSFPQLALLTSPHSLIYSLAHRLSTRRTPENGTATDLSPSYLPPPFPFLSSPTFFHSPHTSPASSEPLPLYSVMSILDLPPELLLNIFESTIPASPSLEHEDYFQRTQVLLSFSLVHSQWTRAAQEILRREVWLGDITFRDEQLMRHCQQLMRTVEGGRTLYLSVDGDIEVLLRTITLERWKDLIYLRNRPMYHFRNSTRFETFAQFPSEHLSPSFSTE